MTKSQCCGGKLYSLIPGSLGTLAVGSKCDGKSGNIVAWGLWLWGVYSEHCAQCRDYIASVRSYDLVRVDPTKGWEGYQRIPTGAAYEGRWVKL